jgi:hypothetical protein
MRMSKIYRPLRTVGVVALLLGLVAIEAASATIAARMRLDPATTNDPAGPAPGPMAKKFHHVMHGV